MCNGSFRNEKMKTKGEGGGGEGKKEKKKEKKAKNEISMRAVIVPGV